MPKFQESITSEEVNALPIGAFHGEIVVVDTPQAIVEAAAYLSAQPLIGFDTETRPSFKAGQMNKVALLQLSTHRRCYLIRLCRIKLHNALALERPLLRLLESSKTIKIGAAIRDDIRGLQKLRCFTPKGFIDLQSLVGKYGINELSLRKMAAITLQIKISKAQRLSNWEAATLTPAQQLYAATDAWVSREIYVRLTQQQ